MIYRYSILFLFVYLIVGFGLPDRVLANDLDSIQHVLDRTLVEAPQYEKRKIAQIQTIKKQRGIEKDDLEKRYTYNLQLYEAYKKYQIDSAIHYVQDNIHIAGQLADTPKLDTSNLAMIALLSAGGKFVEAMALLDQMNAEDIAPDLLATYYRVRSTFYSQYGLSSNSNDLFQESERYRDSMLVVLDTTALEYRIGLATKMVYEGAYGTVLPILLHLCDSLQDDQDEKALVAYLLGLIYKELGNTDLQIKYFGVSAICDIKNAIMDNASMQSLAMTYYQEGDVDRASAFIEKAINDAVFSNVRFRTIESSSFYPVINAAFVEKEKKQQTQLIQFLVVISLLSLSLLMGVIYIYRQMSKLRKIRTTLDKTNDRLMELNAQLSSSNKQLKESDHIKEEYIAQFFDICSTYITKMDVMRNDIFKKLLNKDYDGIKKELQSSGYLKSELEDLYHNFDVIFINLYPGFVSEFNELLLPEEQIVLKDGEHLNSELRIYALIRLGITDNAKIAGFLRYSLRTVYNYRVKTRSKIKGAKEDFEKNIMNMGNLMP